MITRQSDTSSLLAIAFLPLPLEKTGIEPNIFQVEKET